VHTLSGDLLEVELQMESILLMYQDSGMMFFAEISHQMEKTRKNSQKKRGQPYSTYLLHDAAS
jgi:hypothetical protein